MSVILRVLICVVLAWSVVGVQADEKYDLLVVREGWDEGRDHVREILESVAGVMTEHFEGLKLKPIIVYPKGGPIVLYQRGPMGEIVVKLNTGDRLWSQYVYQFAHEMGHILCGYDADPHGNDWFEESICELASLYTLRKLSKDWKASKNERWRAFAKHHLTYAEDRIKKGELPEGKTLRAWYDEHEKVLRKSATNRALNQVVATTLLPMFEKQPEMWGAVYYLNHEEVKAPISFNQFLSDWKKHAPEKYDAFIEKIAKAFEIEI